MLGSLRGLKTACQCCFKQLVVRETQYTVCENFKAVVPVLVSIAAWRVLGCPDMTPLRDFISSLAENKKKTFMVSFVMQLSSRFFCVPPGTGRGMFTSELSIILTHSVGSLQMTTGQTKPKSNASFPSWLSVAKNSSLLPGMHESLGADTMLLHFQGSGACHPDTQSTQAVALPLKTCFWLPKAKSCPTFTPVKVPQYYHYLKTWQTWKSIRC